MIAYDPHQWLRSLFSIRGSLVREIAPRVVMFAVWTAGVVAYHHNVRPVGMPPLLHTLMGVAIGMLLVFRTSSSYERFWEGRKLWGGIVNETRNLVRGAVVHLEADPELVARLTRWTAAYPWAAMSYLRSIDSLGPQAAALPADRAALAMDAQHTPLAVATEMTRCLAEARTRGLISDILFATLDQNIQQLVDYVGGCERIRRTPMPFAYAVHLRRSVVLYCATLPFAMVESFGWITVAGVALLSYTFFGIEEIGVEIEGPFGTDDNDLPLADICESIHKNLYDLAGIEHLQREPLPEGG